MAQQATPSPATDVHADDSTIVFIKSDVPADFPGGVEGWIKYLTANLNYPRKAQKKQIEGSVRVQFIIDAKGVVSEVTALNDPGYGLAEEAVRVIQESGRWKPASQNGRHVKYRHIQSITFKLQ